MADSELDKKILAKTDDKKTNKTNTKKNFKPGKKPAVGAKKSKPKAKAKKEPTPKVEMRQDEQTGIKFSSIVIFIALITIVALALIIYLLVDKKNELQTDLDIKNNQLDSISSEVKYFKEYQDKMDNLIDQASALSDEAHAKDLYILQNINNNEEVVENKVSDDDLAKIKIVRDEFVDAYEDLDWEDVSKFMVGGMSAEQRALVEGLKIRSINIKDAKEVKYTNSGNVYYEINILVRRKGNSNYNDGDNTRYLVFTKVNDEFKVDLVEKIN